MGYDIVRLGETTLRLVLLPWRWRYHAAGYCPSCGVKSVILHSPAIRKWFVDLLSSWQASDDYKKQLLLRENYFCGNCMANFRMRSLAETILGLLNQEDTRNLVTKLKNDPGFRIYETAAYSVFRDRSLRRLDNYVVSEYFPDQKPGRREGGVRNENLECLTFPDDSFDLVITSEVLEHVADLDRAMAEIRRVLKPGGLHVFTVPVDQAQPRTVVRARLVDGRIEHLREPVTHGDTIRSNGILAFREFGADVLSALSREGLVCGERRFSMDGAFVTSVYYAGKS